MSLRQHIKVLADFDTLRTTHIDALAKEGLKFNQIYTSEAMRVPTRASLFTGLYPVRQLLCYRLP